MRVGFALLMIVIGAPDPSGATADPWAQGESGLERAKATISQCLERAASTPPTDAQPCVNAVYIACGSEHGTMSQHDLNDCAYFSYLAWDARRSAVRTRLLGAKTIDPRFGRAEPRVQKLEESARRWDEWNEADCEMQVPSSEVGSMKAMERALCLSSHAAHRALELEALEFWWAKMFKLPK